MTAGLQPAPDVRAVSRKDVRTVITSSPMGTTVEWYDFFLYSTAASLVFDELFFPTDDPAVSTMLAFVTFFVGFVARPLGGVLFGHVGDRIGRKRTLVDAADGPVHGGDGRASHLRAGGTARARAAGAAARGAGPGDRR
ncbi:hypothetical protein [Saccharopolyspora mangrovi]|uniref:MFS transporter n=1 Tax=Saccharopolyspora mangrovi TaxID=3082379 RepID=A0ABU6AAY2_9PSEU|nr:hypothetical protein [Saccharopolyspora sp. S2-29]MEB3368598.1 hypothetical protein [Saccharopolyspora sp. S2-29]